MVFLFDDLFYWGSKPAFVFLRDLFLPDELSCCPCDRISDILLEFVDAVTGVVFWKVGLHLFGITIPVSLVMVPSEGWLVVDFGMLILYEMMIGMWSDSSSFTTSHVTTSSSDGCRCMNEVTGVDPVPDGVCRLVW